MTATTVRPIALHAVPALAGEKYEGGWDGRYRLYTREHLPFDALPTYRQGGPVTVTCTEWSFSTSSLSRLFSTPAVIAGDDGMHTISATRNHTADGYERHELHGTRWPTEWHAREAAYNAGLLGFMVYEKEAARWGLPAPEADEAAA